MIKKFLFGVILSVMMISSLSGCGKTDDKSESYKNNTESGADIDLFKNNDDKKETLIKEDAEDTILDDFRTEPNTPEKLAQWRMKSILMMAHMAKLQVMNLCISMMMTFRNQ